VFCVEFQSVATGVEKRRRNVSQEYNSSFAIGGLRHLVESAQLRPAVLRAGVVIGAEQEIAAVAAYYEHIQSPLAAAERNCN
jgi:hypothetical protein